MCKELKKVEVIKQMKKLTLTVTLTLARKRNEKAAVLKEMMKVTVNKDMKKVGAM